MKIKVIVNYVAIALLMGCTEIVDFPVEEEEDVWVMDGFISNVSGHYIRLVPAPERLFTVTVRKSKSIGSNERATTIAQVFLEDSQGNILPLELADPDKGEYVLNRPEFAAQPGIAYRLVAYVEEDTLTSGWERMPEAPNQIIESNYAFAESAIYVFRLGNRLVEPATFLNFNVIPAHDSNETVYFAWTVTPSWIFEAYLREDTDPDKRCYLTSPYYTPFYTVASVSGEGFSQNVMSIELDNHRLEHEFTALVTQKGISEAYFNYLNGILEQLKRGTIFDSPPFNLPTNITSARGQKTAGYFAVISESHLRWYTNQDELGVGNQYPPYMEYCGYNLPPPIPAPCYNCLAYHPDATIVKPWWWR